MPPDLTISSVCRTPATVMIAKIGQKIQPLDQAVFVFRLDPNCAHFVLIYFHVSAESINLKMYSAVLQNMRTA